MKNKNNVLHQLDKIDSITNQLNFTVKQQQPIEDYMKLLDALRMFLSKLFISITISASRNNI